MGTTITVAGETALTGRCTETAHDCPCRGDREVHERRAREIAEARARSEDTVECPECGAAASPLSVARWGHCRACRTAQSREVYPLRW